MTATLIFSGLVHGVNGPTFISHDMISNLSEQLLMEKWTLCSCALLLCLAYSGKGLSVWFVFGFFFKC